MTQATSSLTRAAPKGRQHLSCFGRPIRRASSRQMAKSQTEPWLLAASPSLQHETALELVNLYRKRMAIEQGFRTLKSHQFGFAFEDSQTRKPHRLAVLLLIHALALLLAWIAGCAAQNTGMRRQLQSNASHTQVSLSIISLGRMALNLIGLRLSDHNVAAALKAPPPLPPTLSESQI